MPVKSKTEETKCVYSALDIGVPNLGALPTVARVHGYSLDHPYMLIVRNGEVFISGVKKEQKKGAKAGNANPARMGETAKKEENNTEE